MPSSDDKRLSPVPRGVVINLEDAENEFILKWWTASHDALVQCEVSRLSWEWPRKIVDDLFDITPDEAIAEWIGADPKCKKQSWTRVLRSFAMARAESKGWRPERKPCAMCGHNFDEDSLPTFLIERLGFAQIDFCAPCLQDTYLKFHTGNVSASRDEVIEYVRSLAAVIGRPPSQGFGDGKTDLHGFPTTERLKILRVLQRKPAQSRWRELFGPWKQVLIAAGLKQA